MHCYFGGAIQQTIPTIALLPNEVVTASID